MLDQSPTEDEQYAQQQSATQKKSRKKMKIVRVLMRSYKVTLPVAVGDLPLKFRPVFVVSTVLVMVALAFLGFTNFSHALPLNDKILHLVCLCFATTVFYFIFDVEEEARRIWFWRHSPLILTAIVCFFGGGIVSEIVQSLLPYKTFQVGDVAANLIGSSIGLWTAYYLERYYRHRREISRLYRPISVDSESQPDSEDEDGLSGTMLLPTHYDRSGMMTNASKTIKEGQIRLDNVWDDREELFGIGDSDEDENEDYEIRPLSKGEQVGPKIIITSS